MIIDSLKNSDRYAVLSPAMSQAFDFIRRSDLAALADGKYEICGNDVFLTVGSHDLREPDDAPLEVHDKYIDIQIVLSGRETFGWAARPALVAARGEFDTQKDIQFFDDTPSLRFTLEAGEFAVFFPSDAHAPLIGSGRVRKCIIKVKA